MIIEGTTISGMVIVDDRRSVPNAPTIGTASLSSVGATGNVAVTFTQPDYDGLDQIISYTATSNTGGYSNTIYQSNSGSIIIRNLPLNNVFKFNVIARNSLGNSLPSIYSNDVVITPPVGQQAYTSSGTYNWTVPEGVTSISMVLVGAGQAGSNSNFANTRSNKGGSGGSLSYLNNLAVTPGEILTISVGDSPNNSTGIIPGEPSYVTRGSSILALAAGGGYTNTITFNVGTASFPGGNSKNTSTIVLDSSYPVPGTYISIGGAGGAGGYTAAGGDGGYVIAAPNFFPGANSISGGAGGALSLVTAYEPPWENQGSGASGGGGVGIYGHVERNALGGGHGSPNPSYGQFGSNGANGSIQIGIHGGKGGLFGGGGGGAGGLNNSNYGGIGAAGRGGNGAVRIIWPGNSRYFPSTRTTDE